jgi:hypothetical protein
MIIYCFHVCDNGYVYSSLINLQTRARARASVYPKVSGLVAWSENCKWYSSLPLDAVVSLFCESV